MAVLVKDCFIAPRLASLNNDREMISNLKIFHRKNLLPSITKVERERDGSTSKDLKSIFGFIFTCICQTFDAVQVNIIVSLGIFIYLCVIPAYVYVNTYLLGTFVCSCCLENDVSTSVLVGYVCLRVLG